MHALIWSTDRAVCIFDAFFLARASLHDQERGAALRADITERVSLGNSPRFPVEPVAELPISSEVLRKD
jgi:hypothetical protein